MSHEMAKGNCFSQPFLSSYFVKTCALSVPQHGAPVEAPVTPNRVTLSDPKNKRVPTSTSPLRKLEDM